ncbi:MAG: hypothetical protein LBV60_25890 [Streptomyces sp.]|jgi:hypothetical protein|nr:hypothetical protein [Streptomyces sp.]
MTTDRTETAEQAAVLAECDAIEADYPDRADDVGVGARAAVMRIRARVAAAVPAPAGGDLRDRIAVAIARYDWNAGLSGRVTASADHYGEADAVLAVLPAPADQPAERRDRYAAALAASEEHDWALIKAQYPDDVTSYRRNADAVLAVADAELQQHVRATKYWFDAADERRAEVARLRAEVKQLRAGRAAVLAEVVAWLTKKAGECQNRTVADAIVTLASKVHRGAVRPNNLLGADLSLIEPHTPADRAAVLRETADRFERECPDAGGAMDLCMCHAAEPLRAWADEAQHGDNAEMAASLRRDGFGPAEIVDILSRPLCDHCRQLGHTAESCPDAADEAQQVEPGEPEPTQLWWGLNDVMYGDTTTVLLSGPAREPYWLELDALRAAALRHCLASPDTEADEPAGPGFGGGSYLTAEHDTLGMIAAKYGGDLFAWERANPWITDTTMPLPTGLRVAIPTDERQAEPEALVTLATPCTACTHTRTWHGGETCTAGAPGEQCDCRAFTAG